MTSKRVASAVGYFSDSYNCSQSVLLSYARDLGLTAAQASRLAAPFGGGMGRRGEVCGAVSGALMVLGLSKGNSDPQNKAAKEVTYRMAAEIHRSFEARHGTILCRQLLNKDISTLEGLNAAKEEGLFINRCPLFVQDAIVILEELLNGA
jgi:C_GCAxxG_C_C family probable redox protein